MRIHKIINNNVISVIHNNKERVVMGKAVGFQKQVGDVVETSKIEKIFDLNNQEVSDRFKTLLIEVPIEVVVVVEKIIEIAKTEYDKSLNDSVYVALTDHINFAIERQQNNLTVKNGLLFEIKRFYSKEYEIGLRALQLIEDQLGVNMPEDEAGFIAIHILNAENNNVSDFNHVTEMVQNIISLVQYHFRMSLDEESLTYFRFMTHLKFFAQRILTNAAISNGSHSLYDIVKVQYSEAYKCVKKIEVFLNKKYGYGISDEEKLYLMIHINRLIRPDESVDN